MQCVKVESRVLMFSPIDQLRIVGYRWGKVASSASTAARTSSATSSLNRNDSVCLIIVGPSLASRVLQDEAQSSAGRQRLVAENRAAQPEPQPLVGDGQQVFVPPDVGVELAVAGPVHDEGGGHPNGVGGLLEHPHVGHQAVGARVRVLRVRLARL